MKTIEIIFILAYFNLGYWKIIEYLNTKAQKTCLLVQYIFVESCVHVCSMYLSDYLRASWNSLHQACFGITLWLNFRKHVVMTLNQVFIYWDSCIFTDYRHGVLRSSLQRLHLSESCWIQSRQCSIFGV